MRNENLHILQKQKAVHLKLVESAGVEKSKIVESDDPHIVEGFGRCFYSLKAYLTTFHFPLFVPLNLEPSLEEKQRA